MNRMHGKAWMLAVLLPAALVACGEPDADTEPAEEEAAQEPAVDPSEAASIEGSVSFEGTAPEGDPIDMSAESDCVEAYGEEGPRTQEVVVSDGRLANVFVHVTEGLERDFPAATEPVVLDQEDCRYHPHVLGIQAGQPLLIRNSDPLLHNINTQPSENRPFNISQPQSGMETERDFSVQEVMVPVRCDVHGWMNAYIGVLDHPYYGVSGEDGSFTLENLPPGDYTVEAWHERYGTQTAEVSVAAQETGEVSFSFSEEMAGAEVPLGEPLILHAGHGEGNGASAGAGR